MIMATIKSYTDLQQSKKLAKILPLESADYHYIAQGEIAKKLFPAVAIAVCPRCHEEK
jgi:hypothetical protein